MSAAATTTAPSHTIERFDGKVRIKDLELFVGYDPKIDDDEERFKKFDADKVRQIVRHTHEYMNRGQNPQLILGHNSEGNADDVRPAIGEITNLRFAMIAGVPGIVGDPVMSDDDFELYMKSNRYPRRSAEIWEDGYLSEVALLGSETPARPLRDTRFSKAELAGGKRERFSRTYAACQFSQEPDAMAHEDDKDKDKNKNTGDDDVEKLKARLQKLEDENDQLKAKLKAKNQQGDDDDEKEKEKEKNARRTAETERDTFKREAEDLRKRIGVIEKDRKHEKCESALNLMARDGYQLGDNDRRAEILSRLEAADEPEKEVNFLKSVMARNPLGVIVDQTGAVTGAEGDKTIEQQKEAAGKARERCAKEGKHDAATYKAYYEEELAAA